MKSDKTKFKIIFHLYLHSILHCYFVFYQYYFIFRLLILLKQVAVSVSVIFDQSCIIIVLYIDLDLYFTSKTSIVRGT